MIYRNKAVQSTFVSVEQASTGNRFMHRIDMFTLVGISLKTTNCIESLNASAKKYCANIAYWKNSSQKCRWLAMALLEVEPSLNKIRGHVNMAKLHKAVAENVKLS